MVAMVIMPSRHPCMGWCVPQTARCAQCDRELHHSYFIYYGHDTLQNCVIHTNPHKHMQVAHGLVNIEIQCLIKDDEEEEEELS